MRKAANAGRQIGSIPSHIRMIGIGAGFLVDLMDERGRALPIVAADEPSDVSQIPPCEDG